MREVTEAHYLHERHGLEAVLRPPVRNPSTLAWIPNRAQLVVGTRDGTLQSIDPVLGTRVVAREVGDPFCLAIHADRKRYVVVSRDGTWTLGQLGGEVIHRDTHDFSQDIHCFFVGDYVVMAGDEAEGRVLRVLHNDQVRLRAKLPKRVLPLPDPTSSKRILLARSTPAGLSLIRLGKARFQTGLPATGHRLVASGSSVLGITATGVVVWSLEDGAPQSMRLPDLTTGAVSSDGKYLGLGTQTGSVALARLDQKEKRIHPDLVKAFDGPVTAVAFSQRGRWLATSGGAHLQLWSWED